MGEVDLHNLEKQVGDVKSQVEDVREQVDVISRKMATTDLSLISIEKKTAIICMLLQGNELDKEDKGLVGVIAGLMVRISKLEKLKDKGIGIIIGLSAGTGYALADLISRIFIKK